MKLAGLPIWFRLGVALEVLIAVVIGSSATFALSAFLPYGPNHDRAPEILLEYAATFLLLPVAVVLGCAYIGARLVRSGHAVAALVIAFAPVVFAPWLLFQSLK